MCSIVFASWAIFEKFGGNYLWASARRDIQDSTCSKICKSRCSNCVRASDYHTGVVLV